MKKLLIIYTSVFLFQISKAQNTPQPFEFGATVLTINSLNTQNYFIDDRPAVEYINALFFRYTKNRFGFRAHTSYSDNTQVYSSPPGVVDGSSGAVHKKDFRIGFGAQFSLLKQKEWFYSLLDLSYRNVYSSGQTSGGHWGTLENYTSTSNGLDCFLGIGFKLKIFKSLSMSPEIGYYSSTNFVNRTYSFPGIKMPSSERSYTETFINSMFKLHLAVKF